MKRLSTIIACLAFAATISWAQSGMTDNQIMDYVIEQNAKGVSRQQIVTQLMQRGVTIDQLRRIQKKYQKQMKNGALGAEDITAGSKAIGDAIAAATAEGAFSLIGGGDSVACCTKFGLTDKVSYISTGGGALLEAIEGKVLPGVAAIQG